MIGYYIHHHGMGHLRRALAITAELPPGSVTGLSSLPRPAEWDGPWIRLERDDTAVQPQTVDANGYLHWVPRDDAGLRERMAALSAWIRDTAPAALVADVSVEAAALARLHGVPVVSFALPGVREDPAHTLGFGISDAVIAAWPPEAPDMLRTAVAGLAGKLHAVGAISGLPIQPGRPPGDIRQVLVLGGAGGGGMSAAELADARRQVPDVEWTALGTTADNRTSNPLPHLQKASFVVTHAGQGALADVAAVGVPALVVPQERPYGEQFTTARALQRLDLPVMVSQSFARPDWADVLAAARSLDGRQWAAWNDGNGAGRAADLISAVADQAANTVRAGA